jgi:hypothetical protein
MSTAARPKYVPRSTPARSLRVKAESFAPDLISRSATAALTAALAILFVAFLFISVETQSVDVRLTDVRMAIMHQTDAIALAKAERLSLSSDLFLSERASDLGLAFPKRSTVIRVTSDEMASGAAVLEDIVYGRPPSARMGVGRVRSLSR